jgi:threonine/homoserine/homoserine lactone efflux protein
MLEGITAGLIFSLTLFPGTVWLAKIGFVGGKGKVLAVALAFWLSHLFWLLIAVPGLMMMYAHLSPVRFGIHLFAAFVLLYMGYKFFRSKRVERIDDAPELPSGWVLFMSGLKQSLAMPMRLPVAMAVLLATGVYINHPAEWSTVPSVLTGVLIGLTWWWGQFAFLAAFFAKRVPPVITIKSLNKIRPFCAVLGLCLAGMVLFFVR